MATFEAQARDDINNIIETHGGSVVIYSLSGAANERGEITDSWISGVSGVAFILPRSDRVLSNFPEGQLVDGEMVGYFKSGAGVDVDMRVQSTRESYKVNAVKVYPEDREVYRSTVLQKIDYV